MEFPSTPEYPGYYDRSPNYHYTFNPNHTTYHASNTLPSVAQYVSVGGQISPGRADHGAGPSSNGITVEIKVINPDKRSENRLFTLRNVDCDKLSSPIDLNKIIFDQLGQNLVSKDLTFDIGYYRGNKRVNILGSDDMQDVRKLLRNKDSSGVSSCTLWCMGLSAKKDVDSGKRTRDQTDSESDTDSDPGTRRPKRRKKSTKKSRHEEKLERIDNIIGKLKTKHGSEFTDIQYRVWAESFDTRYHQSLDTPPQGSLFKAQGRKSKSSKSDPPRSTPDSPPSAGDPPHDAELTPQKAAHLKSTYIQQIKELHSLQTVGAISNEDFIKQRDILLAQMSKM